MELESLSLSNDLPPPSVYDPVSALIKECLSQFQDLSGLFPKESNLLFWSKKMKLSKTSCRVCMNGFNGERGVGKRKGGAYVAPDIG